MGLSAVGIMDWVEANDKETARREELTTKLIEMDLRWGGSSGSGRGGSSENVATKSALLKKIQARLPEDSKIAPQLVGADLETLELFDKGQETLRAFYKGNGLDYTPEQAEADVTSFHREVIKTGGKVDVEDIYAMLGIDEDMADEVAYGDKTYGDLARSIAEGKEEVGLAFSFREPVKPLSGSEQEKIRDLFISSLRPTIRAELTTINEKQAAGTATAEDEARALELDRAMNNLDNDDYIAASRIAGPEAAIKLMETNPRYKPYNYLINQNLGFQNKDDIARAIKVGLIEKGTRIFYNGSSYTITEEDVQRAIG
jgi:hypothetical protein